MKIVPYSLRGFDYDYEVCTPNHKEKDRRMRSSLHNDSSFLLLHPMRIGTCDKKLDLRPTCNRNRNHKLPDFRIVGSASDVANVWTDRPTNDQQSIRRDPLVDLYCRQNLKFVGFCLLSYR